MKFLVYVSLCACIGQSFGVTTENYGKTSLKLTNSIQTSQKAAETYYQPSAPQQQEYVHQAQYIPKPMFVSPQPHAMIIIAQPALMSPNVYYGGGMAPGMQQLLNYFHSNPQAKYQLLYGGYQPQPSPQTFVPQPTHQTYLHQPQPSPSVATYQIVPSSMFSGYNQLVAAPSHINYQQTPIHYHPNQVNHINQVPNHQYVHHQPLQLNHISHMAQMAAQQYTAPIPIRSLPPVITGLEHFTPDQQAQIKAQLGAHFGVPGTTSTTQSNPSQQQLQLQPQQPTQSVSEVEKNSKTGIQNFTPAQVYRTQFTKGK